MDFTLFRFIPFLRRRKSKHKLISPASNFNYDCIADEIIDDDLIQALHLRIKSEPLSFRQLRKVNVWKEKAPDNQELVDTFLNKELLDQAIMEFGMPDSEKSLAAVKKIIFG